MNDIGNHILCIHCEKKIHVKNRPARWWVTKNFDAFLNGSKIACDMNSNESHHAVAARLADKNISKSKDGYVGRMHYSYLKNSKFFECPYLIKKLNYTFELIQLIWGKKWSIIRRKEKITRNSAIRNIPKKRIH